MLKLPLKIQTNLDVTALIFPQWITIFQMLKDFPAPQRENPI